jgi:glutathione S-transferase
MAEYRLYCFAQSGNAYKAALMLSLCGADWEPRFVDFFGGETRTPAYRAINQMGEVPVLEHEGRRLAQSGVILDYLAGRFGAFGWQDDDERREAEQDAVDEQALAQIAGERAVQRSALVHRHRTLHQDEVGDEVASDRVHRPCRVGQGT